MNHTEWFLGAITFLLAGLLYEIGSGDTFGLIAVPVLVILYGLPLYLVGRPVYDHVTS